MYRIVQTAPLLWKFVQNIWNGRDNNVKYRKRWHGGKILFDCQHFHPYRSHWKVGERRWCNHCGELHAVMFVIKPKPKPVPQPVDPNQLSLDDIPPF